MGEYLLKTEYAGNQGCINCHSSSTSSTTYILNPGDPVEITVPVVVYTGAAAPVDYLAGGNFWWVKGPATGDPGDPNYWTGGSDDTKGHNIFPDEGDDYLTSAPGSPTGCYSVPGSCHADLFQTATLGMPSWIGRQGCTKCHMMEDSAYPTSFPPQGFHHADDSAIVVGSNTQQSSDPDFDGFFRFLSGHQSGVGHGVCGIEDNDWQATSGSSDHNEYLGNQANLNAAANLSQQGHTMTGYCSGCHGNFHVSSGSASGGNWIHHPVGVVMPNSGEFSLYTIFDPDGPVARSSLATINSTVTPGSDLANCLSCHRAHGSPYPKLLRQDPATASGGMCVICHTGKISNP